MFPSKKISIFFISKKYAMCPTTTHITMTVIITRNFRLIIDGFCKNIHKLRKYSLQILDDKHIINDTFIPFVNHTILLYQGIIFSILA